MIGFVTRIARAVAHSAGAILLTCSLATAQTTVLKPQFELPVPIGRPAPVTVSCAAGFAANPSTMTAAKPYLCSRALTCSPSGAALAVRLFQPTAVRSDPARNNWSFDCTGGPGAPVCPSGMTSTTLPAGAFPLNYACSAATPRCPEGTSFAQGTQGYTCTALPGTKPQSVQMACGAGFAVRPAATPGQYTCTWTQTVTTVSQCPGGQYNFSFGAPPVIGGVAEQFSCTYAASGPITCPAGMTAAAGPTNSWFTSYRCVASSWDPTCSYAMTPSQVSLQGGEAIYTCTPKA